jgi:hypothetical protein
VLPKSTFVYRKLRTPFPVLQFVVSLRPALAFVVVVSLAATVSGANPTPLSTLLNRTSTYVDGFLQVFSTVVAEEQYVQDARGAVPVEGALTGVEMPRHVELRSDFLFVTTDSAANWLTFRDVYAVNGRAVRDREERLAKLFLQPDGDRIERARRIAMDGYRYNIGSPDRTIANPLVVLGLLQQKYRAHFEFAVRGIDPGLGPDTWILKFDERVRPTILRTADHRDVSTSGRVWIDGASGRVLQTELNTSTGDRVLTVFRFDERMQLDVPVEMRDLTWFNRAPITGVATYTKFRRFVVSTSQDVP